MFDTQIIKHSAIAILIVIGFGIIGQAVKALLSTVFKKLFESTKTTLDDRLLKVIRTRVTTVSIIIGLHIAVREVRKALSVEDVAYHQILDYLSIAFFLVLVFVLTRLISRLIEEMVEWYMDEVSAITQSNITATVAPMTTKIINIILFLIACIIVLDHFGINIGSLLVSLGVGSLAVALAAQETVANMIAGFVILVDQPFRVGDHIKLPSGDEGDVYQIGLRSTRILNVDNNLVIIPNGELVKSRITNFAFPEKAVRIVVEVNIAYGSDIDKAKKILLQLASRHADILSYPPPEVFLFNFGDSALQLRLVGQTANFMKKFHIETNLREEIYATFRAEQIEIPYPQRVIQVNTHAAEITQKK